jgi:DNA-binding response OmpR family regulator
MTDRIPATILVAHPDARAREFLADNLAADGYDPVPAESAADALRHLRYKAPDLAVLALRLPDRSGLEVLDALRASDGVASPMDPATPVIALAPAAAELDRQRALERGADDVVGTPFSYPELRLRIGAVLRRTRERRGSGRLRVGDLEVDPASREVTVRGRQVRLAQKEYALLQALAAEPTRVFTKEELLRDVWGFRSMGRTRTLDSHACRLRQKLGTQGDRFVVNVWGVGYRLVDGRSAAGTTAAVAAGAAA